jgi:hypothetical protein
LGYGSLFRNSLEELQRNEKSDASKTGASLSSSRSFFFPNRLLWSKPFLFENDPIPLWDAAPSDELPIGHGKSLETGSSSDLRESTLPK